MVAFGIKRRRKRAHRAALQQHRELRIADFAGGNRARRERRRQIGRLDAGNEVYRLRIAAVLIDPCRRRVMGRVTGPGSEICPLGARWKPIRA